MLELMCRDKYTLLKYLFQYSYTQKQTKVLQDSSAVMINM